MSQFFDSIKAVKSNYKRYDDWEQAQADDVAKREYLSKKFDPPADKVALTKAKAEAVFRASNLMDKRSEDNCADMEQTTGFIDMAITLPVVAAGTIIPLNMMKKGKALTPKQSLIFNVVQIGFFLIAGVGIALWGNAKQKEASRIGRFQARSKELQDVKNFALYTPEQVAQAQEIAKKIPNKKDKKKSIMEAFQNLKQMKEDKKEYLKYKQEKAQHADENKILLNAQYTPEQLQQGEEDKEIIVNIVKDVNMKAEEYSQNAGNIFDTVGMLGFLTDIPIYMGLRKILKNVASMSQSQKKLLEVVVLAIVPLATLFWSTHEKKEASRVGRFVKKKEILDNPELIMSYPDEQLKQADKVKAPSVKKSFLQKWHDNLIFFGKYLKDRKAYEKYQKKEAKEDDKLYEALKKVEISPEQLNEAKHLQKNTFKAFEKMDEMSQRYSEDIEAGGEIVKELINAVFSFLPLAPVIFGILVYEGKIPPQNIAKWVAKKALKPGSPIKAIIDKGCAAINSEPELKKNVAKALADTTADKKMQTKFMQHPKLKPILEEIQAEYMKIVKQIETAPDKDKMVQSLLDEHFKTGTVSKYFRNLAFDCLKIYAKAKQKAMTLDLQKQVEEAQKAGKIKKEAAAQALGQIQKAQATEKESKGVWDALKYFHKNFKTLSSTIIALIAPILGLPIVAAYAFNSWLTNIQIKAGRIGIMKAMDDIDHPQLYVNQES